MTTKDKATRRNYQTYGAEGLIDRLPGARGPHPNRVSEEVEAAILAHALDHPSHGALRVAQDLSLPGVQVSSGGVRGVWSRHKLLTKQERLLRLEKTTCERQIEINPEQIRLLERFSPEFRERHIHTRHTGDLVAVETFFVGHLKGVGKVYLQTAVDCHSRYAWGRLYPNKLPVTAVHIMNNEVLPTFDAHQARISTVLSDNGREFCGRLDRHPYELFLHLEHIEHRTTQVRRPQSNGFVERLHRTLLDEHFRFLGPNQVLREHLRDADRPRRLPSHVQHPQTPPGPRHERQDTCGRLRPRPAETQETKGGQKRKSRLEYSRPGAAGVR